MKLKTMQRCGDYVVLAAMLIYCPVIYAENGTKEEPWLPVREAPAAPPACVCSTTDLGGGTIIGGGAINQRMWNCSCGSMNCVFATIQGNNSQVVSGSLQCR